MSNVLKQVQVLKEEETIAKRENNTVLASHLTEVIERLIKTKDYCMSLAYYLSMQTGESYYVIQLNNKDWTNEDDNYFCVSLKELSDKLSNSIWKIASISQMFKCKSSAF